MENQREIKQDKDKKYLLNIIIESFEDLNILQQSVKKAFADLDKDISDLCFKFITVIGLSTFLLSGTLNQSSNICKNKSLIILYFMVILFHCLSVICYWWKLLKSSSIHNSYLSGFITLSGDYDNLYKRISDNNINSDTILQIETFLKNCSTVCKKQPLDHPVIVLLRKGHHVFYTITIFGVIIFILSALYIFLE